MMLNQVSHSNVCVLHLFFEKIVEPNSFDVICSRVGIGWCSLLMASFKYMGSKQMHKWPSHVQFITRLFNHLMGPVGLSIMPCFSI